MRVQLIETHLIWENVQANLEHFSNLLSQYASDEKDIFILPEMFSTGFTMNTGVAEKRIEGEFPSVTWMKKQAAQLNAAVVGSVAISEDDGSYNRLFFVRPNGEVSQYNKRHLFSFAGEHEVYRAGQEQCLVSWRGWNILLNICYDLRFPIWTRNEIINGSPKYDLLIYVANWPSVRAEVWKTLLRARAIENVSYVIGVNRIGEDGNGHVYSGDSAIINFRGESVETLSLEELQTFRAKFPALEDADSFTLG
jgi:omega-amidase